ncbi:MAG: beta-ketoacyl-ACP synthase 3 [Christensenellales bacterium]
MIAPVKIAGIAKSVPKRKVTNFELEKIVDTSDDWITKRTGIKTRYLVSDETTISLGSDAALRALTMAGVKKDDIRLIIASTFTGECLTPSVSSQIQKRLDIDDCACMDLSAGCTGFVFGLVTAASLMDSLNIDYALVVASEVISSYIDWEDRSTCVLFGDGAGAAVLKRSGRANMRYPVMSGTPDREEVILLEKELKPTPFGFEPSKGTKYLKMKGSEVFTYAVGVVEDTLRKLLDMCGDRPFNKVIMHQANAKIIDFVIRKMDIGKEQFFLDIDEYANTSSATIPIAICDAYEKGWLVKGDRVALVGFGSGLTYGGVVIDWAI